LALSGLAVNSVCAQIVFQDNFEDEPVSVTGSEVIGAPQVGVSWTEGVATLSGTRGVDISDLRTIGTRSLRVLREGTPPLGPSNGNIDGISLANTALDGNVVEVKWSNYLSSVDGAIGHRFNSPMQMSIGMAGSDYSADLAFISIGDGGNGSYHYTNSTAQYGNITSSGVQSSLDAWDTIRAVLTLDQIDASTMGGTYDLFVSIGGGAEQQLVNDALLSNSTIPGINSTNMQLRIGKGPSTAHIYYDDVSVTVVPEPTALALGGVIAGMLSLRRRMV